MASAVSRRDSSLSLVVPAFGEAANVRALVPVLLQLDVDVLEVIIVDDHSTDRTFDAVRELAASDQRVRGVRLARNSGSHLAILCGLKAARGQAAVVMAADGQDPPALVSEMVAAWKEGSHVVWAVRAGREGESLATRFFSRLYYFLMNRLSDVRLPPSGADFFLADRRVVEGLLSIPEHRLSLFTLVASLGFRQAEIPYVKQARATGSSKWTARQKLELVVDSLVGFSTAPLRLAAAMGFLYGLGGFTYAALLVVNKLLGGLLFGEVPVTGFAALMTVLLISSGSIMLILGIFGEYLWRALDEVRGRPRFLVEETVNLDGDLAS
jgi:glycosyltransferase involved in cell wall biosynthesis